MAVRDTCSEVNNGYYLEILLKVARKVLNTVVLISLQVE